MLSFAKLPLFFLDKVSLFFKAAERTSEVLRSSNFTKVGFFTMGSNLEETQYNEVGLSEMDARKYCAMEALKVLYNVQYPGTLEDYMINCEHQDILDY